MKTATRHACGKVQELAHELKRYRLDNLHLAAVGWTEFGEATMDEGDKLRLVQRRSL